MIIMHILHLDCLTHTHTHTHVYTYIYIYICVYIYLHSILLQLLRHYYDSTYELIY